MNHIIPDAGTVTREVAGQQVAASYGNDSEARAAYMESAALVDRSHWGLIRVTGSTRHSFLHNMTTNDMNSLKPGQGFETVFLTSTARCIDVVQVFATEDAIWLISSPERRDTLLNWMPRFVFFNDDVQFSDESDHYAIFSLLGPTSGTLLDEVGASDILGTPAFCHRLENIAGVDGVRVVVGGGLVGEGYTLIAPSEHAATLWQGLREAGAEPMGEDLWEALRVEEGRPAADRELTEDYNPLEAGLWQAVSFAKGCYIGQEIVARLDTYQKLKQQLWGLRLSVPVQPGTSIIVEDKEVGAITSVTDTPEGPFGLGYIRVKAGGEGLQVQVGDATATVVDLPYITRERADLKG